MGRICISFGSTPIRRAQANTSDLNTSAGTGQHRQLPYSLHHHQPLSRTPQPICQCSRPLPAHGHSQYCRADPLCPQSSRVHLQTRLHLQKSRRGLERNPLCPKPSAEPICTNRALAAQQKDHPGHGQNQLPLGQRHHLLRRPRLFSLLPTSCRQT